MTDWKSSLRTDPIPWLLDTACPPVRYRVLTELLDEGPEAPRVLTARQEALGYPPAVALQRKQKKDGTWGSAIHASDSRKFQLCLENALTALFEYGWSRDTRPVRAAARPLKRFLTNRRDLPFYEFAKGVRADPRREEYYRWFLRILALGLLVRAGYHDERSRHAVLEVLEHTAGFVEDPISRHPTEEIGARHPLIRPDAWRRGYPFLPDLYVLRVFAFSPWLLEGELAKIRMRKIFDYVMSETYQGLAPELGLVRTAKGTFLKDHGLRFRPLDFYHKHGCIDELLGSLELMARLGLVNRYPLLMTHLDWLHSQQGKDGRWNLSTELWRENSRWTSLLRLEKDWRSPARKEADMTFRILLILKYQWRRQMQMLDRRDDGYPI
jgi:hypothetical protein